MKTKKKNKKTKWINYELHDYRGKTIHFNNYGAMSLFKTATPSKEQLALAQKVLQKPDYIFKSKPFNHLHLIKRVAKQDYLFQLGTGYAGKKSNWYLSDIKKIKVKKVERNALHYDQPYIWRKIKVIHPAELKKKVSAISSVN